MAPGSLLCWCLLKSCPLNRTSGVEGIVSAVRLLRVGASRPDPALHFITGVTRRVDCNGLAC